MSSRNVLVLIQNISSCIREHAQIRDLNMYSMQLLGCRIEGKFLRAGSRRIFQGLKILEGCSNPKFLRIPYLRPFNTQKTKRLQVLSKKTTTKNPKTLTQNLIPSEKGESQKSMQTLCDTRG